jgi:transposase
MQQHDFTPPSTPCSYHEEMKKVGSPFKSAIESRCTVIKLRTGEPTMDKYMLCGIDAHDKTLVCCWAVNKDAPAKKTYENSASGLQELITQLREDAQVEHSEQIVLAYEASALGFGLYDAITDAGLSCHVLAPHKMRSSSEDKKRKNDERDALKLLEELRGHYLAGNTLPDVWIPDHQTRHDRQLVRARFDIANEITRIKAKIRMFLKVNTLSVRYRTKSAWTVDYRNGLAKLQGEIDGGLDIVLSVLLKRLAEQEAHRNALDEAIETLSREDRYHKAVQVLVAEVCGVSTFSAMVFLTELGDLKRFKNRNQVAAYLGLAPCSFESGESNDRKGHITRQGSHRVRKVLCQSVWCQVSHGRGEIEACKRIVERNPKKKKIAIVACMRRVAIRMWHKASEHQPERSQARRQAA